jgi:large subunit ribosomal protein L23
MSTSIIIRPIITEKSMKEAELGKFTFQVAKDANKTNIKKAIEGQFSVNVTGLSTILVKGKRKRIGARRSEVKESVMKKAIATLKSGQKIDLFEMIGQEAEEEKK